MRARPSCLTGGPQSANKKELVGEASRLIRWRAERDRSHRSALRPSVRDRALGTPERPLKVAASLAATAQLGLSVFPSGEGLKRERESGSWASA